MPIYLITLIGYMVIDLDRLLFVLYGGAMDIIKNASGTIFKRLVWHTAKIGIFDERPVLLSKKMSATLSLFDFI